MTERYGEMLRFHTISFVFDQWEAKVQRCQQEFEEISVEIKREIERFEMNRVRDFKSTIIKYLQDQMAHQQQVHPPKHKVSIHLCGFNNISFVFFSS